MPALKMRPARRLPLIPPKDAWEKEPTETVVYDKERKTVYERFKPIKERSEIQWMKDAEGGPVWSNAAPGTEPQRRTERVETVPKYIEVAGERVKNPEAVEEFILHQGFGTNISLIFNFRESPEKLEREREEAENERLMSKLLGTIKKNPEKLERLLADGEEEEDPPVAAQFKPVHEGFGRWYVEDTHGERVNEDALDKEAAHELAQRMNAPPEDSD